MEVIAEKKAVKAKEEVEKNLAAEEAAKIRIEAEKASLIAAEEAAKAVAAELAAKAKKESDRQASEDYKKEQEIIQDLT